MEGKPAYPTDGKVIWQGQGQLWLGNPEDVKFQIDNLSQKLKDVKKRTSTVRNHESLDQAHKTLAECYDELLIYCQENKRRYTGQDAKASDRQKAEHDRIIKYYQDREQKLQKDLNEAIKAKENALNRLSEIQSRLLKHNNPEITDLSDENRPTILGTKFKELYEDEWTDAFEFLTEQRKERLNDENTVRMLYAMLKHCNEFCATALRKQHMALAQLVCDPTYLKFQVEDPQQDPQPTQTQPQSKPPVSGNVTKLDIKPQSLNQQNTNTTKMPFAQTLPSRTNIQDKIQDLKSNQELEGKGQGKTVINKNQNFGDPKFTGTKSSSGTPISETSNTPGVITSPRTQMLSEAKTLHGGKMSSQIQNTPVAQMSPTVLNTAGAQKIPGSQTYPGVHKPSVKETSQQLPDLYEAKQTEEHSKSAMVIQMMEGKLQTPIREFSKMAANDVLANVNISNIFSVLMKTDQFPKDIFQNTAVQKYLEKCFHLCWLMQVQSPPMLMDMETKPGTMFDANVFEIYSNRGQKIAIVVWPPLYLHKDGPVVCKGYADCAK